MKKSTIIKIQETINILTIPVAGSIALWVGVDVSACVAAIAQGINGILEVILKFMKD